MEHPAESSHVPMHHAHRDLASQSSTSALLLTRLPSTDHVALDVAGGGSSSTLFVTSNEIEADRLKEIDNDVRLKLILADWQARLRESQERKERKHTLSLNVKNEIYQLIGFFRRITVLDWPLVAWSFGGKYGSHSEGVVLTTVSQASQLTCHNWWGPFALSLLASITTLFGVCNKFHNFIKWKRATDVEVENSKVLKGQISRLKKFGADFKFSEHAPDVRRDNQKKKESRRQFCRYYILAVLVTVSMMGFSVIMLISCQRILCDQGSPNPA